MTSLTIGIAIYRQPDANMVEIADAVRAMLPSLRAQIPPSIHIEIASGSFDRDPGGGVRTYRRRS